MVGDVFKELCIQYVEYCAVLNHLRTHEGSIRDMEGVIDELDGIKKSMLRELDRDE